jgi:putative SOS response-associated peptidase YedK
MSERFGLIRTLKELRLVYNATAPDFAWEPMYNIPALAKIPVLVEGASGRELRLMRWGLIPNWAKDEKIALTMTNARAETVAEKPAYKDAVRSRRCLIPASGFYAWKTKTLPFWIAPAAGLFSLAGVWESFTPQNGETIESCTILTTDANTLVATVQARMPCVLPEERQAAWLKPATPLDDALALLKDPAAAGMTATPVSTYMNSAKNQGPRCIQSTK